MAYQLNLDEFSLGTAPTAVLAAVVRGEVDLNQLAREELANRGRDEHGMWVGFAEAARILQVKRLP